MSNRFIPAIVLGTIAALIAVNPAVADTAIFDSVSEKTTTLFTNARNILMIVGAIGVLGLATMAFFGKFKWTWAVSLLGGLALIAFVSQVLTYFGLTAPSTSG